MRRTDGDDEASTTARGYGYEHQRLRRLWQQVIDERPVACWRCGRLIPVGSRSWDLGHDDVDRNVWRGPEHRRCNRATASRRVRRRLRTSRAW